MRLNRTKSQATRLLRGKSTSAWKKGMRKNTKISSTRQMIWTWRQEQIRSIRTLERPSHRTSTSLIVAIWAQARAQTSRFFPCRPRINNCLMQCPNSALESKKRPSECISSIGTAKRNRRTIFTTRRIWRRTQYWGKLSRVSCRRSNPIQIWVSLSPSTQRQRKNRRIERWLRLLSKIVTLNWFTTRVLWSTRSISATSTNWTAQQRWMIPICSHKATSTVALTIRSSTWTTATWCHRWTSHSRIARSSPLTSTRCNEAYQAPLTTNTHVGPLISKRHINRLNRKHNQIIHRIKSKSSSTRSIRLSHQPKRTVSCQQATQI